jgi:hypothetical protein
MVGFIRESLHLIIYWKSKKPVDALYFDRLFMLKLSI